MLKRINIIILALICFALPVKSADNVFNYPQKAKIIQNSINLEKNPICTFSQEKTLSNGRILRSSGNFKITKRKEVIFETLYPIHTLNTYSSQQNKRISKIIESLSNNDFTPIEKSFKTYYLQNSLDWVLGLKSNRSQISDYVNKIVIYGNKKNINKIILEFQTKEKTVIKFKCN